MLLRYRGGWERNRVLPKSICLTLGGCGRGDGVNAGLFIFLPLLAGVPSCPPGWVQCVCVREKLVPQLLPAPDFGLPQHHVTIIPSLRGPDGSWAQCTPPHPAGGGGSPGSSLPLAACPPGLPGLDPRPPTRIGGRRTGPDPPRRSWVVCVCLDRVEYFFRRQSLLIRATEGGLSSSGEGEGGVVVT